MAEQWIASRTLTDTDGKPVLEVRIGLFCFADPIDWECPFVLAPPGEPGEIQTVPGIDAVQALSLALEAIRVTLAKRPERLCWLGQEPGITGFHRVTHAFGYGLVERLEHQIDEAVDQHAREVMSGRHRPPAQPA